MEKEINVFAEIEAEEKKQALSIPAKRLREKLLPLKSKEEQTAKRWFWELLQNASDYNETVDILLEVSDSHLVFNHNGKPFSIQDVLNLISPDSGKDKDEVKKENIGKFGSGLVSTHILSSEIEVKGAFESKNEGKLFKFHILLDRSCYENKDKLIDSIEAAKKEFRGIDTSIENSEYEGFMTSFSYDTRKKLPGLSIDLDVVQMGLEHIYEVLPFTLCFMTKVQSVEIIDKRSRSNLKNYFIKSRPSVDSLQTFEVTENDRVNIIKFVKLKYRQVETVYQHKDGAVCPMPDGISRLFCGLPMIGSENIGLPLIVNSFDFEPTLEREGVEITPNDRQNINLFKQSVKLYQLLLNDVSQKKLDNAFCLTRLNKRFNGVEASKNIFRRDFIPAYKKIIESSIIVRNAAGVFINFSKMILPYKDGKPSNKLYELASEIKQSKLPIRSSYEGWFNGTDFNLFQGQKYDLKQFVSEISQIQQVQGFVLHSKLSVLDWLKGVASLVCEENENLFSNFAILPNQKGTLKLRKDLCIDECIPVELKKIYNKLNPTEIEIKLVERVFNEFEAIIEKRIGVKDICNEIDALLEEAYTIGKASTKNITLPLNDLYKWVAQKNYSKNELKNLFPWFYPRRAALFMDSFNESERDYAFTIVQSGKMKALAKLAEVDISSEEIEYISSNPDVIAKFCALLQNEVDDRKNADLGVGEFGELLVFNDLRKKYKQVHGYEIIWSSKNGETRFDFEVRLSGKTVLYVDAKTTMRGLSNSDSIPFFIRKSQWEFLPKVSSSHDVKYLIARVFKKDKLIKYLEIIELQEE